MINFKDLNFTAAQFADLLQYGGVKIVGDSCIGRCGDCQNEPLKHRSFPGKICCHRSGDCTSHVWKQEILITDEVQQYNSKGDETKRIDMPIRYFNLCYALWKTSLDGQFTDQEQWTLAALKCAKLECFDDDGQPQHLPRKLGKGTYSKFLNPIDEYLQKTNNLPLRSVAKDAAQAYSR